MSVQTQELDELTVKSRGKTNGGAYSGVDTANGGAAAVDTLPVEASAEDVHALVEVKLSEALEEAKSRPRKEVAEPQDWWDIIAIGPIQPGAAGVPPAGLSGSPLLPHQVIRVGERAFVASIILLNPFGPGHPTAADILSGFGLPFEIRYRTGNLETWSLASATFNATQSGNFTPFIPFAIDIFSFVPRPGDEGCHEMNVCARIFGCSDHCNGDRNTAPPFAGFARRVIDIDPGLFFRAPGLQVDTGIRFQVYD